MTSDDLIKIYAQLGQLPELMKTVSTLQSEIQGLRIQFGTLTKNQEEMKRQLEQVKNQDAD